MPVEEDTIPVSAHESSLDSPRTIKSTTIHPNTHRRPTRTIKWTQSKTLHDNNSQRTHKNQEQQLSATTSTSRSTEASPKRYGLYNQEHGGTIHQLWSPTPTPGEPTAKKSSPPNNNCHEQEWCARKNAKSPHPSHSRAQLATHAVVRLGQELKIEDHQTAENPRNEERSAGQDVPWSKVWRGEEGEIQYDDSTINECTISKGVCRRDVSFPRVK